MNMSDTGFSDVKQLLGHKTSQLHSRHTAQLHLYPVTDPNVMSSLVI